MSLSPNFATSLEKELPRVIGNLADFEDRITKLATSIPPESKNARELTDHLVFGACRRSAILSRALCNLFSVFPPSRVTPLARDELWDVQIFVHAFMINIAAITDNIAWALLLRRGIDVKHPRDVGLSQSFTREYMPKKLLDYVMAEKMGQWREAYLTSYRDALVHRVPPYVPPGQQTPTQEQDKNALHRLACAAFTLGAHDQLTAIDEQMGRLAQSCPIILLHSAPEGRTCRPVQLHPQVLSDAITCIEICDKVIEHWDD